MEAGIGNSDDFFCHYVRNTADRGVADMGELMRNIDKAAMTHIPCDRCNGVVYEFSIPNDIWNHVIRIDGIERDDEYICRACWHIALRARLRRIDDLELLLETVRNGDPGIEGMPLWQRVMK